MPVLAYATTKLVSVIFKNRGNFDSEEFKSKYENSVKDLNTKQGFIGTYRFIINKIRWVLTIAILVYARNHNEMQLISLMLISWGFQAMIIIG